MPGKKQDEYHINEPSRNPNRGGNVRLIERVDGGDYPSSQPGHGPGELILPVARCWICVHVSKEKSQKEYGRELDWSSKSNPIGIREQLHSPFSFRAALHFRAKFRHKVFRFQTYVLVKSRIFSSSLSFSILCSHTVSNATAWLLVRSLSRRRLRFDRPIELRNVEIVRQPINGIFK